MEAFSLLYSHQSDLPDRFEGSVQGGDQILHILRSDGQADGVGFDALIQKFLIRQLAVGRGVGMNHQRFHVRHIGQQGEDGQIVNELLRGIAVTLDLEGEDAAAAVREIL